MHTDDVLDLQHVGKSLMGGKQILHIATYLALNSQWSGVLIYALSVQSLQTIIQAKVERGPIEKDMQKTVLTTLTEFKTTFCHRRMGSKGKGH